jgi:hypothetical protein
MLRGRLAEAENIVLSLLHRNSAVAVFEKKFFLWRQVYSVLFSRASFRRVLRLSFPELL